MDEETIPETLTLTMPDGRQEVIDMTDKQPFNDPNCPHEATLVIGDGDIPGTVEVTCKDCPVGWLFRP